MLSCIKIFPPLKELNVSIPLIKVFSKESMHVLERSLLYELLEGLKSRNQV